MQFGVVNLIVLDVGDFNAETEFANLEVEHLQLVLCEAIFQSPRDTLWFDMA